MDSVVTISNPVLNTCIICLADTPVTVTYSGSCNCKPKLHELCLQKWIQENSDVCPICRKSNNVLVLAVNNRNIRPYFCCCLCLFGLCIAPFAVLVFIAIYKQ